MKKLFLSIAAVAGLALTAAALFEPVSTSTPSLSSPANYPNAWVDGANPVGESVELTVSYVDEPIAELEGKTVRRMLQYGGNLYILALDAENAPTLLVYDPAGKKVITEVSTEGMQGKILTCSDIQITADGVLLACNKERVLNDSSQLQDVDEGVMGEFRAYRWENDENGIPTGAPQLWITGKAAGLWLRSTAGESFVYCGTSQDGTLVYSNANVNSPNVVRTSSIVVSQGAPKNTGDGHKNNYKGEMNKLATALLGNYRFIDNPAAEGTFIIDGDGEAPMLGLPLNSSEAYPESELAAEAMPADIQGAGAFRFNNAALIVAPATAEGQVTGVQLYNITDGLAAAKAIDAVNGTIEAAAAASSYATGACKVQEVAGKAVNGWMELYLLRDNKLTAYTTYKEVEVAYENYPNIYENEGEAIPTELTFSAPEATVKIAELEGTTVRRAVYSNGRIYILALQADNAPVIVVYDVNKAAVVANVSTEGMEVDDVAGPKLICSDIQVTADGVLLGCTKQKTHYDSSYVEAADNGNQGTWRVYSWENDANGLPTGAPALTFSSKSSGLWFRSYAGDTFAYSGTLKNGKMAFSNITVTDSKIIRFTVATVTDSEFDDTYGGVVSAIKPTYNGAVGNFIPANLGEDYRVTISPTNPEHIYVHGSGSAPVLEIKLEKLPSTSNTVNPVSVANETVAEAGAGSSFFKFNGASIMAIPGEAATLANVTEGIAAATAITANNAGACQAVVGRPAIRVEGENTTADIELFAINNGAVTKYTSYEAPFVWENYPNNYFDPNEAIPTEFTFGAEYADEAIAELEGKTIRRLIQRDNLLYILALDAENAPTIFVYDVDAKATVATVSTEGMEIDELPGPALLCSDIQVTADGVLLAATKQKTQYADEQIEAADNGIRGKWRLYRWENDANGLPTGTPALWLESLSSGLWYRSYAGTTFAYSGSSTDGMIVLTNPTTGDSGVIRITGFEVVNGEVADAPIASMNRLGYNGNVNNFNEPDLGNYRFIASPTNDSRFIVVSTGEKIVASEYGFFHPNTANPFEMLSTEIAPAAINSANFVKYNAAALMVAATADGLVIANIANGLSKASAITVAGYPIVPEHVSARVLADGTLQVSAIADGKLTLLSTAVEYNPTVEPEAPQRAAYAYGINVDGKTITYSLSANAVEVNALLTNTETQEVTTYPLSGVKKGTYTEEITGMAGQFSVEIEVISNIEGEGDAIEVYAAPELQPSTVRGGIAIIRDTEEDAFGMTVVSHGKRGGFDVYDQTGKFLGKYHQNYDKHSSTNQSSPFRGDALHGKAYFADWSDMAAGEWVIDPLNPETEPYNYLLAEGAEQAASGLVTLNGVGIGGGTSTVAFSKDQSGDNLKMYTFEEDLASSAGTYNYIAVYNIGDGTAKNLTAGPVADLTWSKSLMANTNVDIEDASKGYFASQVRANYNDVTPAWVYINDDNKRVCIARDIELCEDTDGCSSGIALNYDETLFAIANYHKITICAFEWTEVYDELEEADITMPALTKIAEIPVAGMTWSQIEFDRANNLHVYAREVGGYHVFALTGGNTSVTPAKAGQLLNFVAEGVENVAVEAIDLNATYYNLQGQRVAADNLTPGIYVKVQGKAAKKVLVK